MIEKAEQEKKNLENFENRAFIIGNGTSRKKFNLEKLRGKGKIYGCNALYRTFYPDELIVIDDTMRLEIDNSPFPQDRVYQPPEDQRREPAIWNKSRPMENAGMMAMRRAIQEGKKELFLLGIDFVIEDYDSNIANMFANTMNYSPRTVSNYEDVIRRCQYFEWFSRQNPDVKFYFVIPKGLIRLRKFASPNTFGCFYEDFESYINKTA